MSVGTQYLDILWLKTFGLFSVNVLDYFYTSPFFDQSSNNQLIRTQGVAPEHLISMVGIEYVLDEHNISEPNLYVIKKQLRESPRKAELLEIYYIIDGIIHQSPDLLQLFRSRISKASYYLGNSFAALQSTTTYTSKEGRQCWSKREEIGNEDKNAEKDENLMDVMKESDAKPAPRKVMVAGNIREFPPFLRMFEDLKTSF